MLSLVNRVDENQYTTPLYKCQVSLDNLCHQFYDTTMNEVTIKAPDRPKPRFLRLTAKEFEAISTIANENGMKFSQYVRLLVIREIARVKKIKEKGV